MYCQNLSIPRESSGLQYVCCLERVEQRNLLSLFGLRFMQICTYISSCMHCLSKTTEIRTNGNSIGKVMAAKFGTYHTAFFASELRKYPGHNPCQCDWWKAEASSQPC